VAGPGGPLHDLSEVAFECPSGNFVVVESSQANPAGTSYVRLVDHLGPDGKEIVYWVEDEWAESPEEVMGAIFGAMVGENGR
jgi:hypothetical protein